VRERAAGNSQPPSSIGKGEADTRKEGREGEGEEGKNARTGSGVVAETSGGRGRDGSAGLGRETKRDETRTKSAVETAG